MLVSFFVDEFPDSTPLASESPLPKIDIDGYTGKKNAGKDSRSDAILRHPDNYFYIDIFLMYDKIPAQEKPVCPPVSFRPGGFLYHGKQII